MQKKLVNKSDASNLIEKVLLKHKTCCAGNKSKIKSRRR